MKTSLYFLPLLYLIFFPVPIFAKTLGFALNPPTTEILLSPNQKLTTTLTLTNLGEDTNYFLSLHPLLPYGLYGHSTLSPKVYDPTTTPLTIKVLDKDFNTPYFIKSQTTQTLTLELESPSLDHPQDVYFGLMIKPALDTTQGSSVTTPGIAALFFTTLTPLSAIDTDVSLHLNNLPRIHDSNSLLTLAPRAQNNSTTMLRVKANLTLTNYNNQTVFTQTLDPLLVLGKTTREFNPISYLPTLSQIGPHTLTVKLSTEGDKTLATHTSTIWLLPLKLLFFGVVFIFFILILKLSAHRLTKTSQ